MSLSEWSIVGACIVLVTCCGVSQAIHFMKIIRRHQKEREENPMLTVTTISGGEAMASDVYASNPFDQVLGQAHGQASLASGFGAGFGGYHSNGLMNTSTIYTNTYPDLVRQFSDYSKLDRIKKKTVKDPRLKEYAKTTFKDVDEKSLVSKILDGAVTCPAEDRKSRIEALVEHSLR